MSDIMRRSLGIASIVIGLNAIAATTVSANPTIPSNVISETSIADSENEIQGQVTSVSQLTDVQPTDWAFQALQSLVERYGCIAGYPNSTYRGNRALTRYEFAAGLNACLNRVNELIASSTADLVTKEDLATLQKLQTDFADTLAEVRGRVDALENRTAILESQQFSTTTKFNGEVIFSVGGVFGEDRAIDSDRWRRIEGGASTREAEYAASGGRRLQNNTIFSDRIRLNLVTSFTGKDQLLTRLEANNTVLFNNAITGTNMTRLSWDGDTNNEFLIGKLYYRFPVGNKLNVIVDAIGGEFYDNFNNFNPLLASIPLGSISRASRFSPIYRASNSGSGVNFGTGVSVNYKLSDQITFSGGYLARRANDPTEGRGLFDGSYGALAQLAFQPNKDLALGFTYAHAYFSGANNDVAVSGLYGGAFADQPFGAGPGNTATSPRGIATSANYYSFQTSYRVNSKFVLSGWVGYTQAIAETTFLPNVNRGDKADIWNWAVTFAFPDLGKKGNLGGIIFGQPPKVTDNDFGENVRTATSARREDSDTSYRLEALYRHQVNDNISITPGLLVIFNPEHNSNNDTIYTGIIRTTFRF
ncbi:iron uptake porin [Nostoc sp. FACHB-87]|uniref:iron uptake porin n=1 Tax=Nostocaceae TaxID=1162 RepID=UPI001682CF84|nr:MULTISPECIES: iron uptake porin [Nostocaceae]MBD2458699.1 iron uptake porin [Nostoc sp. FACHB-87]MBD2478183.1 iron uptake porin [Anabaena sp. FACHB-83]